MPCSSAGSHALELVSEIAQAERLTLRAVGFGGERQLSDRDVQENECAGSESGMGTQGPRAVLRPRTPLPVVLRPRAPLPPETSPLPAHPTQRQVRLKPEVQLKPALVQSQVQNSELARSRAKMAPDPAMLAPGMAKLVSLIAEEQALIRMIAERQAEACSPPLPIGTWNRPRIATMPIELLLRSPCTPRPSAGPCPTAPSP